MSYQIYNTHPIVREALKNFFNDADVEEFISKYLTSADVKDSKKFSLRSKNKIESDALKSQIDFEINNGLHLRTQVDLLTTFAEQKFSSETFIEFLVYLGQSTIISGENTISIDIHEKIINATKDSPGMVNITANAYFAIGEIYSRQAQWELSWVSIDKAVQLFREENDIKGNARCENLLGTIQGDKGNTEKAREHFENALTALLDIKDPVLIGKIEINLGIINNIQGNYNEALSYLRRALLNFEKVGDLKRIAEIRQNLGVVYTKKKEFPKAVEDFDLSIEASIQANYLQTLGIAYISKAYAYTQLKDYKLANAFAEKAMEVAYKINDKLTIAEVYKVKGIINRNTGNFDVAENYLLTSLRLNKDITNQLNLAETSYELGLLYKSTNSTEKSKQHFIEALGYYRRINAKEEIEDLERLIKE